MGTLRDLSKIKLFFCQSQNLSRDIFLQNNYNNYIYYCYQNNEFATPSNNRLKFFFLFYVTEMPVCEGKGKNTAIQCLSEHNTVAP